MLPTDGVNCESWMRLRETRLNWEVALPGSLRPRITRVERVGQPDKERLSQNGRAPLRISRREIPSMEQLRIGTSGWTLLLRLPKPKIDW